MDLLLLANSFSPSALQFNYVITGLNMSGPCGLISLNNVQTLPLFMTEKKGYYISTL